METKSTTGIRYLHKDYRDKYGNDYIVRHSIRGKNFVVWRGNDFETGKKIAEEISWIIACGNGKFLYWYDNERLDYLASIGTNDGSIKSKWNNIIGKQIGKYKVLRIVKQGKTLRDSEIEVECTLCGTKFKALYKNIYAFKYVDTNNCYKHKGVIKHGNKSKGMQK